MTKFIAIFICALTFITYSYAENDDKTCTELLALIASEGTKTSGGNGGGNDGGGTDYQNMSEDADGDDTNHSSKKEDDNHKHIEHHSINDGAKICMHRKALDDIRNHADDFIKTFNHVAQGKSVCRIFKKSIEKILSPVSNATFGVLSLSADGELTLSGCGDSIKITSKGMKVEPLAQKMEKTFSVKLDDLSKECADF